MTPRVAFVRVYVETLHSGRLKVTLTREAIWILSQELFYPYCMCCIEHFRIYIITVIVESHNRASEISKYFV